MTDESTPLVVRATLAKDMCRSALKGAFEHIDFQIIAGGYDLTDEWIDRYLQPVFKGWGVDKI